MPRYQRDDIATNVKTSASFLTTLTRNGQTQAMLPQTIFQGLLLNRPVKSLGILLHPSSTHRVC